VTTLPAVWKQTAVVPPDHNRLVVHLQGHSWVSVSTDSRPLVRTRSADPAVAFTLAPGTYVVRTDGTIESMTTGCVWREPSLPERLRRETPALLTLTSDAPDRHIVDGLAEIAADGASFCAITVQKADIRGFPVSGIEHQDELFVRTTGGSIMDEIGERRIRSLRMRSGRAVFRLVSEIHPKVVTVSVLSSNPLISAADIRVEFV
jgi:hypothetical protein